MERALYSLGGAMYTQRKRLDVLANNIANAETPGYKSDALLSRSFADVLIQRINDNGNKTYQKEVGPYNHGIHIDEVYTDYDQGSVDATGIPTNFALEGAGFFTVQTADGTDFYTRNGEFHLTPEGGLVTAEGYAVMGTQGAIIVDPKDFAVDAFGNIVSGGAIVNTFALVDFADPATLRKQGNGLIDPGDQAPAAAAYVRVHQNALEVSNINLEKEMVAMIELSRNYESNQRMMRIVDDSLSKAANNIANV